MSAANFAPASGAKAPGSTEYDAAVAAATFGRDGARPCQMWRVPPFGYLSNIIVPAGFCAS